ncbi:MAG TPA: hypothetical protein VHH11_14050 [Gammaproteobacteria bacterium]|nr:hypothetical protein [Gammaproteobacteria bacterium]
MSRATSQPCPHCWQGHACAAHAVLMLSHDEATRFHAALARYLRGDGTRSDCWSIEHLRALLARAVAPTRQKTDRATAEDTQQSKKHP